MAGREDQTSERAAHILTPPSEAQIPDLLRAAGRLRLGITSITRCLTTACHIATAGDVLHARAQRRRACSSPTGRRRSQRDFAECRASLLPATAAPETHQMATSAQLELTFPSLRHLPRPLRQRCPVWIREGLSAPSPSTLARHRPRAAQRGLTAGEAALLPPVNLPSRARESARRRSR